MENSTAQTVAQAVQAATQQQAQAANQLQGTPVQGGQTSTIDNLTCQWQGCGERCESAEALYDHVCERHVGRKSTNNLNLTCQWGACRTTTVKRDHITSHIRVHVPLKPHKCDFCGKAFKRPQDLKKHVKTHADDSVLMNSPSGQSGGQQRMTGGGINPNSGQGYYSAGHDTNMSNPYPTYQPPMGSNVQNGGNYPQHGHAQYTSYGSVSYPNNTAAADLQSLDTRRRAIEALNEFLGDIKRRAIDPGNYYDVGQRLGAALPLPVGGGYNTGYNNAATYGGYQNAAQLLEAFNNSGTVAGAGGMQVATQGYSLPLPNARTKNDLQEIDRFLEQLQATVYETSSSNRYETSNQAAAAGVAQPGVHSMHTEYFPSQHTTYRSSHSPPSYNDNNVSTGGGAAAMPGASNLPSHSVAPLDTPVLTPASVSSFASSGHSPMSSHSRSSNGNGNGNQMYPSLPAVTNVSEIGAGYPTTTSAPAPSLASNLDAFDSRRYSGGRLQRQAPSQDTEMPDADGALTPKASDAKRTKSKGLNSIDPALRGEDDKQWSESGSGSSPGDDKRQEQWVENIRVIEQIKTWVNDRLKNGEYEDDENGKGSGADTSKSIEIAKMVEEKMADADAGEVKYPTLPSN